jgi:hypothetical protein
LSITKTQSLNIAATTTDLRLYPTNPLPMPIGQLLLSLDFIFPRDEREFMNLDGFE